MLSVPVALGCGGEGDGLRLLAPEDLPERVEPPPALETLDGDAITTEAAWKQVREPELRVLFQHYVYGYFPADPGNTASELVASAELAGGVDYREYEVRYGPPDTPPLYLAVFSPVDATAPVPVFLALNPCGNHSLTLDDAVRISEAWIESGCDPARGSRAERWPIADIVSRGYALATFHQSDVDPDDGADPFADGIHPHFSVDADSDTQWGTLAAWSFGVARAVDVLVTLEHLDGSRIATVGHSRRGKVALIAAAFDDRVAMAIPHQSGTGGATLSRSYLGEPVSVINVFFPHWFDDLFPAFGDRETYLPVDQHQLIAMVAPRPVLITNGADDDWADPPGALLAAELAQPVYELLGSPGMVRDADEQISLDGDLVWHQRDGGHSLEARDWATFMDFADRHF